MVSYAVRNYAVRNKCGVLVSASPALYLLCARASLRTRDVLRVSFRAVAVALACWVLPADASVAGGPESVGALHDVRPPDASSSPGSPAPPVRALALQSHPPERPIGVEAGRDAPEFTDAELLALEISGELLPPSEMVARIDADLSAVRAHDPFFEEIHARPTWIPGQLNVRLQPDAWDDYLAGEFTELDSLNALFEVVDIGSLDDLRILFLDFAHPYHPLVLEPIYAALDGIQWANPNSQGGDGNDITAEVVGVYAFRLGWGDCPAGCIYQHVWVFQVEDGVVTLLEEYGDEPPTPVESGTWGRLKAGSRHDR